MPRCGERTAAGEPCRAFAVRGSEPPRCSAHLGVTGPKSRLELDPDLADRLATLLRAGVHVGTAADATGIAPRTLRLWMRRGRSEDPRDRQYRALVEHVERARTEGEIRLVAQVGVRRRGRGRPRPGCWSGSTRSAGLSGRGRRRAGRSGSAALNDPFAEVDELAEARTRRERGPLGS